MKRRAKRLQVWKADQVIGTLDQTRSGLRFEYQADTIERVGLGRPLVSMSMPTSKRPFFDRLARPFFDGLLPEGEARRIIAYDLGLPEADTFGLLQVLGRDCAGALSLVDGGEAPWPAEPIATLAPLDRESLDVRIRDLRFNPLGIDNNVRVSLAGVQEKLVLTALPDGRWALPTVGVASTHILKPAIPELAFGSHNEALCLRFAAQCGVRSAVARVDHLGGRDVLVVERFDRFVGVDGIVSRMHQETACQALAVPVAALARKYQDAGGPSLLAVANVVRRWSGPGPVEQLLAQLVVNVLVGNADAHAMNISFMIEDEGAVSLSPMYDVFSTIAYPTLTTTAAMFVNEVADIRLITLQDMIGEAVSWGVPIERATEVVVEICNAAPSALERAIDDVPAAPSALGELLRGRVESFRTAP